jgi:hypothetical protein
MFCDAHENKLANVERTALLSWLASAGFSKLAMNASKAVQNEARRNAEGLRLLSACP